MPTTTDGKKFDYTKLGMMKAKMHQQRLDKNKKSMGSPYSKAGIAAGASIPAFLVALEMGERYHGNKVKQKIAKELNMTKNSAGKWKMPSGGGGGGIYNVAQPVADKNIMNKYGKKLK